MIAAIRACTSNDVQLVISPCFSARDRTVAFGPFGSHRAQKRDVAGPVLSCGLPGEHLRVLLEGMMPGGSCQGLVRRPRIVTMALVRDQFSGRQMARLMSFVMAVFILVPALAPLLGQGILWLGSWRTIFTTFFAVAAVSLAWVTLRQPETLPVDRRRPFSVRAIDQAVGEIVRIRTSLGYTWRRARVRAFVAYWFRPDLRTRTRPA